LKEDAWLIEGECLSGSHVLHPRFRLEVKVDPRSIGLTGENDVYLTDSAMGCFKRISPFIRSAVCPECRHPRILVTDGGDQFIDVFMGHRVKL
jgi:hypothetical protein